MALFAYDIEEMYWIHLNAHDKDSTFKIGPPNNIINVIINGPTICPTSLLGIAALIKNPRELELNAWIAIVMRNLKIAPHSCRKPTKKYNGNPNKVDVKSLKGKLIITLDTNGIQEL
jgi:hypothetical protein